MYEAKIYKGDYLSRQQQANEDDCVCYVEQHFNASDNPRADYAVVVTADNASSTSIAWGKWYAREVAKIFETRTGGNDGVMVGGYGGRGNANLMYTAMPAILLEPLFGSTPRHAELIRSSKGQDILARVLVASIWCNFPKGGLVGLSVGHKYKESKPDDRGAAVYGTHLMEADFAELVINKAMVLLNLT